MATAVSAPGKVLLAGGYLVVDRDYTGLVFGLNARIHVHVDELHTSSGVSLSEIIVRSPQFRAAEWRYGYRLTEDNGGVEVIQLAGHSSPTQPRNHFVETALAYTLTYVSCHTSFNIKPATITIFADSDYYSRQGALNSSTARIDRFVDFGVPLHKAHKTGLGSSAALVTAFVAAVLLHYLPVDTVVIDSDAGKARVHNLAQAAHCNAQGKIGSGFDVAAAVYGSCIYRRFSPAVLERLGELGSPGFAKRLLVTVNDNSTPNLWDTQIQRSEIHIPKGLRLVMCDVDCGSETPAMVKKVFTWRKENQEEAALLWATLQKGNEDLAAELRRLATGGTASTVSCANLRGIILTIRSLVREMSEKAGVPIEPKVQTELIDACSELPGVVGGLVPGAGGFDAIAMLVKDSAETVDNLSRFLDDYKITEEGQKAMIGKVRLLEVKQEMVGVKAEDVKMYNKWV
ncbi:phosphomevalonate kinase [Xylographa opegraphella]|nr:phosphomevalonate kinase [Xylographa opegraphella]